MPTASGLETQVNQLTQEFRNLFPRGNPNPSDPPSTSDPFAGWPDPEWELRGGVEEAYFARDEECLSAGPAGSGKSLAWLLKVYWICRTYPGARVLIVRKTRESLTESVLVTWERDILGYTHPILTERPNLRKVRQHYQFPNNSIVVVGGMDKPDKVLSSEWDLVYCPEATELEITDWETLGGRLRAGAVPYQQLLADCNPTTPQHWLYKRCQAGHCKLFPTTHQDNPRYWNQEQNAWTEDGKKYMARLERMTGTRRKRFLLGLWEQAEGLVYAYDEKVHLLPESWEPDRAWKRVWSIDWGMTSPTVVQMWAYDPAGRMYLWREFYQTNARPDQVGLWAKQELESGEKYPEAIVCDHDDRKKGEFERTSGLYLTLADKADRDKGIEEMQARFDLAEDGNPRVFFRNNCRETFAGNVGDAWLEENGHPTSCLEELVGYVHDEDFLKDEPIDYNDHAMDAMRYGGRYVDANTGTTEYPLAKTTRGEQVRAWNRR